MTTSQQYQPKKPADATRLLAKKNLNIKKGAKMYYPRPLQLIDKNQAGLTIAPERMQRVQTRRRTVRPLSLTVRTFCRLGSQRRLFLLWA
jgi:hypothetical protein